MTKRRARDLAVGDVGDDDDDDVATWRSASGNEHEGLPARRRTVDEMKQAGDQDEGHRNRA